MDLIENKLNKFVLIGVFPKPITFNINIINLQPSGHIFHIGFISIKTIE